MSVKRLTQCFGDRLSMSDGRACGLSTHFSCFFTGSDEVLVKPEASGRSPDILLDPLRDVLASLVSTANAETQPMHQRAKATGLWVRMDEGVLCPRGYFALSPRPAPLFRVSRSNPEAL